MTDPRFHPRLEALRGLAALMVAYFHALAMVRMDDYLPLKIKSFLNIAANGTAGVTIFFVLSGYVLGRSLEAAAQPPFVETLRFIARRTLRIWPAMAVCLACCFLWVRFVHVPVTFDAASSDYYLYWREGAAVADLARDLLLLQTLYNPVTWTLQVEMIAAVLFVPAWWVWKRWPIAGVALLSAWALWFVSTPHPSRLAYMYMLLIGMTADRAAAAANRYLGPRALTVSLALAFVGCGIGTRWPRETASMTAFIESVFAFGIVALLVASQGRVRLWLFDHPVTRFLGRISYSFYLWHFAVNYVLVTWGLETIDAARWQAWPNTMATLLFVVSTLCTVPIAWASYRWIEQPVVRAGKAFLSAGR
jgi:peptidoglycan/LPS O-acetylase OafA/YrhL